MCRLGSDIEKFFQSGQRPLPTHTALNIALQLIDTLGNRIIYSYISLLLTLKVPVGTGISLVVDEKEK
jgi:hypothetical protein